MNAFESIPWFGQGQCPTMAKQQPDIEHKMSRMPHCSKERFANPLAVMCTVASPQRKASKFNSWSAGDCALPVAS